MGFDWKKVFVVKNGGEFGYGCRQTRIVIVYKDVKDGDGWEQTKTQTIITYLQSKSISWHEFECF